ncbi:MAG: amidase, partial [Pseudomonadota bacterium]
AKLGRAMQAGEVSAAEAMQAHLDRIAAVNPAVNALVSLRDPDEVMAEARAAGHAPARGEAPEGSAGLLFGQPAAPKDLSMTKGLRSTQGSPIFKDHVPEADDLLAGRMRAAGTIFVGKANTPEFGLGSHTFNEVFGATLNPWDMGRTAGGSSGGGSVAAAMRMLPVADGSDMMGSLRNPAGWANIMGMRPSWGRIPNSDAPDVYTSQLAVMGPMGRSAADLALLLDALAGFDPAAPLSLEDAPSFFDALEAEPDPASHAKGLRIGWLGDLDGRCAMDPGILETCEAALKAFEGLGAAVEPARMDLDPDVAWESWTRLRHAVMAAKHREAYEDAGKRALLKPEVVWEIESGLKLSALDVHAAWVQRTRQHLALEALFARYDLLAVPSAQVWPFPVEQRFPEEIAGRTMDTYHRWMEIMIPASLSGRPAISVPAGFCPEGGPAPGTPIGVQLIGPLRDDLGVLRAAAAFETAADWVRQAPPEPA